MRRLRRTLVVLGTLALLAPGCDGEKGDGKAEGEDQTQPQDPSPDPQPITNFTWTGAVLDAKTRTPIVRATVTVSPIGTNPMAGPFTARPNLKGIFTLSMPGKLEGQPVSMSVEAPGYTTWQQEELTVTADSNLRILLAPPTAH